MKAKLLYSFLTAIIIVQLSFSQNSNVTVSVKWGSNSYENKVELYNTANDLLMTLCDDNQCYTGSQQGVTDQYGARYDLGCVTNGNNYYIKLYDLANDGWTGSLVTVNVAGVDVVTDTGSSASTSGHTIYFNVSGGDAACSNELDTDNDRLADYLDYDDDGDGITDGAENLGQDRFECTLPELAFENGTYDSAASTSSAGTVGAVYRFSNAIQGYDVLMEITELTNAAIHNIDNDSVDNPTYLQTELTLTNPGTPGATFQFTIVDAGTTNPSSEIFRINGITWDCDGGGSLKESVIYYDAAAYGTENPTSLEITDLGSGDIQISASGLQEGPGFSTLKVLRAYYQFIGNSFSMRMQGIRTSTGSTMRQFGMSFTQCEFLDFNADSLIIITGEDADGDGKYNHLDLDSDNDGIPDNVEAQTTLGYIPPTYSVSERGIDIAYGSGLEVIDTDGDNTPDVLDLDTDDDGLPDIEENGMANSISSFSDSDNDGLDLLFEGSNSNDPTDVNDDINNPESSILPDADGDLYTGGDLDYRDYFNVNPPTSSILDFDGTDDYLTTSKFLDGSSEFTLMAWVKIDSGSTSDMTVLSEGNAVRMTLLNGNQPEFSIRLSGIGRRKLQFGTLPYNEWHHIAGSYSGATGDFRLYIDGELKNDFNLGGGSVPVELTTSSNGAFEIGRLSRNLSNQEYFKGDIDEVRVFNIALTEDQLQQMVYQEIENNNGNIRGTIIPKDIEDFDTNQKVSWNNLLAYYPMTDIVNSTTSDFSGNNKTLSLRNITSVLEQTAPMPYQTNNDGSWTSSSTWLHADVWDIEDVENNKPWSIVEIKHNVESSNAHEHLGLFVDASKSLELSGDQKIENHWYLELNGTIDLLGDSQLVQDSNSDLVTSSTGRILRRQEGNASVYWYNYWSSPVGSLTATSLTNNNASTNNSNNTDFKVNMLKEGNGSVVQFTSANDEVGKVSTRWLYTFQNGMTYYDWSPLNPNTNLQPGVGYTQKGIGNAGTEQQFIFEGKPNNGTILINVTDTGGSGSVPSVSKTDYLLGNPYPSALDIHQFIDDNEGVIDGTLQLWQQWSGDSHVLDEYNGGYAQVNKMGSVRAYQFVGLEGANNGSQDGTKTPTKYLPVGQGFITEIVTNGTIEFNNGQRVYIKESDANGSYSNGSVFFRSNNTTDTETSEEESTETPMMQKIRLEFNAVTGPATRRELLLGFSDFTTDGYDYGYDALLVDENDNDLSLIYEDQLMTMQAYSAVTPDKIVPLSLRTSGDYNYSIKATDIQNFDDSQPVYLKDNVTGVYFDLKSDQAYQFSSETGIFDHRFEIVFQTQETLSVENEDYQYHLVYYNNTTSKLIAKGFDSGVDRLMLINILGQTIQEYGRLDYNALANGVDIMKVSAGTYVVYLQHDNQVTTKKIIIK